VNSPAVTQGGKLQHRLQIHEPLRRALDEAVTGVEKLKIIDDRRIGGSNW
jgi:hypothetical protein